MKAATIMLCLFSAGLTNQTLSAAESAGVKTVILFVRHAEPDTSVAGNNPPLSPEGHARARALVQAVQKATDGMKIQVIFTTQFLRTYETAQPLAEALSLKPKTFQAGNTFEAATRLRKYKRRAVLVVGHRNTIPEMIHYLTGKEIPPIAADEYDSIFVITFESEETDEGEEEETVRIETKKYGEPYVRHIPRAHPK